MRQWFLGCVATVFLVASTSAGWPADNIRVGFVNPGMPGEKFWLLVSATMQAAADELGISVDIRYTGRSHDKAIEIAHDFINSSTPPDYLIATNDVDVGGEIIKAADAKGVPVILLSNHLDPKQWTEYGEPRTKYRHWLGSIVPDHEGGGYGIAEAVLTEAARVKQTRPLKMLALAGDIQT